MTCRKEPLSRRHYVVGVARGSKRVAGRMLARRGDLGAHNTEVMPPGVLYAEGPTPMPCKSCGSENLGGFNGELAVHFRGLQNINEPVVLMFPELIICRDCGFAEFIVREEELRMLTKGKAAGAV